ncbi:Transcription elongation factor spt6, variant 4, partial [Lathyrus oleraceus]
QLGEATVKRFYAEHSSKSFFSSLVKYMTSGPVLVMVLEKDNAVADWRALMGPTDASKAKITHPHSIRAKCGLDTEKNCVHGSDSTKSAQREILFFFDELAPDAITEHDELMRIVYSFGICHEHPGTFVLTSIRSTNPHHEYIGLYPKGFRFRKKMFEDIDRLVAYFQRHIDDPQNDSAPSIRSVAAMVPMRSPATGGSSGASGAVAAGAVPLI